VDLSGPSTPLLPSLWRGLVRPIQLFFRLQAASGLLLLAAALGALVWANSPFAGVYRWLFEGTLSLSFGDLAVRLPARAVIDDGLMTIFFFLVGLEIKRELAVGELRSVRRALLPALAALGGMLVPAAVYALLNRGGAGARGWAIPMATDIAFSIGVLTMLKGRVSHALIVFLTALAIFDDLAGIAVIAIFYGHGLEFDWAAVAAALVASVLLLGLRGVRSLGPYLLAGALLWFAVRESGIHPTIAGVLLGLSVPARTRRTQRESLEELRARSAALLEQPHALEGDSGALPSLRRALEELESPLSRFIHVLHPWVAFGIVPLFALANSGVDLSGARARDLLLPVSLGCGLGLFLGKQVGIFTFALAASAAGVAPLPEGVRRVELYGVSIVGGIGFTVALFIAGLAFPEPALLREAKLGILCGSLAAGVAGYAWLRVFAGTRPAERGAA
jgi:NhaA family Na+:H+ antiporter